MFDNKVHGNRERRAKKSINRLKTETGGRTTREIESINQGVTMFDLPDITVTRVFLTIIGLYLVNFVLCNFRKFQLWKKQGIPYLNPWLVYFRFSYLAGRKGPQGRDLTQIRQLGTIYGSNEPNRMTLWVTDADALKDVLVRDFNHFMGRREFLRINYVCKFLISLHGQEWKRTRTIMTPAFSSGKMKAMFPLMERSMESLVKAIDSRKGDIEVIHLFGCLTMDVIARVAFAIETNTHDDPAHPFVLNSKRLFDFPKLKILLALTVPRSILEYFNTNILDVEAFDYMVQLAQHMLNERRKTFSQGSGSSVRMDFLDLMLETGKDTLTDEEIVANIILFLFAGFHTSSTALAFAVYELARHQGIQERVREEIVSAKEGNGGVIDYDLLNSLTYLEAVINETLRMYPPLIESERECTEDYVLKVNTPHLGKRDIFIPKGTGIVIPIYAIHYMEEYFPNPETFNPERFLPANKDQLVPYTFLAFATGPRNCIGMRFAYMEMKLALVNILSRYRISLSPKTADPIKFSSSPALLTPKEIVLKFDEI